MSSSPMRVSAGFTQDTVNQPLGLIGMQNPFFYADFHDDFTDYNAGDYTVTATGNGAVAATTGGVGGRVTFTTNSSTPAVGDIVEVQTKTAWAVLSATKKFAFLARINSTSSSAPVYQIGAIQETTTPATITDGLVATRAHGATAWVITMYAGSASKGSVTIPDSVSGYTAGADFDIGLVYDGKSDVLVFMGSNLVGQVLDQNTGPLGPVGRFTPSALPTVALAPTLAMQSGAAASTTMTADFFLTRLER